MAMQVPVQLLHMNGGEGAYSYYNNSLYQKKVMLTAKPILEESISELVSQKSLPKCLMMADFGSLHPDFLQKLEKEKGSNFQDLFIGAMPGSFYGRLFPSNSLHFVQSSCSLHWSSQVPEQLIDESGISLNKDNICLHKSSSESVLKAYINQFHKDFTNFLRSRAKEMVTGGNMVITLVAKSDKIPYCKYGAEIFDLFGDSLKEMVNEGLIKESTLDSFNIPFNAPSEEQVRNVIEREGSFKLKRIEEFELRWDDNIDDGNNALSFDLTERSKYVTNSIRAVTEPIFTAHFGDVVIDNLFYRFSLKVVDYLEKGIGYFNFVVVSMTKTK
ncbi:S-adenosyl-L-methionine-dependent methyltransferases superfamily protein [Euphorbia peplus]|nr:S-adenosyl-L-methionine-dependent methyltransferases superfamily protein [Euphorbia peplus]